MSNAVPSDPVTGHFPEEITVPHHADGVECDGGSVALGHPVVFYSFDGRESVTCQYCGRVFVRR